MSFYTEFLSEVSDRLFEPFVYKSARRYASVLNTPDHFIDLAIYLTPPTTTGCGLFRELDTSFPFLVSFVVKEINFT
jgi:hypothetical protein